MSTPGPAPPALAGSPPLVALARFKRIYPHTPALLLLAVPALLASRKPLLRAIRERPAAPVGVSFIEAHLRSGHRRP